MNYYNEIDSRAAAWLRALIERGLIAPGFVDERSITDVQPDDLVGFTQCHFFAGIGGWSYALRLAGWSDDKPVWTGSCPCQPFSTAGKHKGTDDERHLWPEFARLIGACQPPVVFGEQVASAAGRDWLSSVRLDLEGMGYAVGAADLCAASVGAPQIRQRLYFGASRMDLANSQRERGRSRESAGQDAVHADTSIQDAGSIGRSTWLATEPQPRPLAHGVSAKVVRLRGYGNAIVPQVAQAFIEAFIDAIGDTLDLPNTPD